MFVAIENYSFQISPKISGFFDCKINQVELVIALAGVRPKLPESLSRITLKAVFWHSPKASAKNMASYLKLSTCKVKNLSIRHSHLRETLDVPGFWEQF
jgi:hypothetical protein